MRGIGGTEYFKCRKLLLWDSINLGGRIRKAILIIDNCTRTYSIPNRILHGKSGEFSNVERIHVK
jgi:hypothetical protein